MSFCPFQTVSEDETSNSSLWLQCRLENQQGWVQNYHKTTRQQARKQFPGAVAATNHFTPSLSAAVTNCLPLADEFPVAVSAASGTDSLNIQLLTPSWRQVPATLRKARLIHLVFSYYLFHTGLTAAILLLQHGRV